MKLLSLLSLVSLITLTACSTKIPQGAVTFHSQTSSGESKHMVFAYTLGEQTLNMRKMPDFVTTNFESFRPFPSKEGKSFGARLQLNELSTKRLVHYTTQRQGLYMISMVNGKVSEPILIDKPISDGVLIIWGGLSLRDIRSLDIELPRTGEDKGEWKKRSKKAKRALKEIVKGDEMKKKEREKAQKIIDKQ